MAANIEDQLIERLRTLPPAQQERVLEFVEGLQPERANDLPIAKKYPTIWEMVEDIISEVPPEAWDDLPTDGSINVDHYLYGAPKREK